MHPIERIRSLARATWLDPVTVAVEAADAIADTSRWLGDATAVSIARRLLAWHSFCGPLWFAAARVLEAVDPDAAAAAVTEELLDDPTPLLLDAALPASARPLVVGSGPGLADLAVHGGLQVEWAANQHSPFSRTGQRPAQAAAMDAAARAATHVVVGASVLGPSGAIALEPAAALVDLAGELGTPVWVVAGVGTPVDSRLWARLVELLGAGSLGPETRAVSEALWDDSSGARRQPMGIVPLDAISFVCGPLGLELPAEAATRALRCPASLLDAAGSEAF